MIALVVIFATRIAPFFILFTAVDEVWGRTAAWAAVSAVYLLIAVEIKS